jgi:hypothetical protein
MTDRLALLEAFFTKWQQERSTGEHQYRVELNKLAKELKCVEAEAFADVTILRTGINQMSEDSDNAT